MDILAATGNAGKLKELKRLLADLPIRLRDLNEFPQIPEPEETGATFVDNAILKARYYAAAAGLRSLADDSGLAVEALGGAPGVLSARYAGAGASDRKKIKKLLSELNKTSDAGRRARFVCAMAICDPDGAVRFVVEEYCQGAIAEVAKGTNGFGYDPIFIPENFVETFGELSAETKQKISHRARAAEKIIQYLRASKTV